MELILDGTHQPSIDEIADYIGNDAKEAWKELTTHIEENYKISPKMSYSKCQMQPGWNVKYQKSGKAFCTLYPEKGVFSALITLGDQEFFEIEMTLSSFGEHFIDTFKDCPLPYNGSRWFTIRVYDKSVIEDIKKVLEIKAIAKKVKR